MSEQEVQCPFCGESFVILVDPSVDSQSYIEDCSVCCRPIQFRVLCQDQEVIEVRVQRE